MVGWMGCSLVKEVCHGRLDGMQSCKGGMSW